MLIVIVIVMVIVTITDAVTFNLSIKADFHLGVKSCAASVVL